MYQFKIRFALQAIGLFTVLLGTLRHLIMFPRSYLSAVIFITLCIPIVWALFAVPILLWHWLTEPLRRVAASAPNATKSCSEPGEIGMDMELTVWRVDDLDAAE